MNINSKNFLIVLIFTLVGLSHGYAQCTLGSAVGAFDVSTLVDDVSAVANTVEGGEYVPLNNMVANKTYVIDACSDPDDTYLTLFNASFAAIDFSDDDCGDDGKITFVAPANGTYYVQLNVGNCGTNTIDHDINIKRLSCNYPSIPTLTASSAPYCVNSNATINISGSLNDAQKWMIYKDECGGEELGFVTTNSYTFQPLLGTRKYFVKGVGGCPGLNSRCDSIELTGINKGASFFYSSNSFCINDSDPTPIGVETSGGTYSSTPAGLSINTTTGVIDNSASTPGNYTVTYTTTAPCSENSSVSVQIRGLDDASFAYGAGSYCKSGTNPTPTITGVSGGTFSSTTGLSLNAATGEINLNASTAGTYIVTYTTTGNCGNSGTQSVIINPDDNAGFSYSASSFCLSATDPVPAISGNTGGAFSSSSGLSISPTTGIVDLSASSAGLYNISYTTAGSCPTSSIVGLTVLALDDASYDYGKVSFCTSENDPAPAFSEVGTFTSTPAGLIINSSTGLIDISASTAGTYSLVYTTSGTCPNTSSKSISISSLDNAAMNYGSSVYCQSGSDPTPTITGLTGGSFSSTPLGLNLNTSTGEIDLSTSIAVNYSVTYTTAGACPNSSSVPLNVTLQDNSSFNYSKNNFCVSSTDPTPTVTGISGGSFSVIPVGMSVDPTSGLIDISASDTGNYDITYTTAGSCPTSTTRNIILSNFDDASFSYSESSYCAFSTDALPTITGLTSGAFSSSPIGLSMLSNNGYINTGASEVGTYTITYTTLGDCQNSSNQMVTILPLDDASFIYDSVEYCVGSNDPTPVIVGELGGTFSSSPIGLSINSSSGEIDLSVSASGLYTVQYKTAGTCSDSSSQSVVLLDNSDASFTYSSSTFCTSEVNPSPSITGMSGGLFSSTPIGLVFNQYTGEIDLESTTPGTYSVYYSVQGDCPNMESQIITVTEQDDASFTYSMNRFCSAGSDPTPTVTGITGGSFSASPAGLVINSIDGTVDVSSSVIGNYVITYTTNGACQNSSSRNFILEDIDNADFNYDNSTYCISDTDPSPIITGQLGGSFSATPSGLSIQVATGVVDLSASTPGIYTITYLTSGDCPNTSTQSFELQALDDATFGFSSLSYCSNHSNEFPTVTGLTGGTFSSFPVGLDLDINSGEITPSGSLVNTYIVEYLTNGGCPNSSTQTVTLNALDDAGFNYGQGSFCSASANPFPSITGDFGGTFSSVPVGLTLDANSGEIDITSSQLNSYTVTYTTNGLCPESHDQTVVLNSLDDASFNYLLPSYCSANQDPTPTISGTAGGAFSYAPSGLVFDEVSGTIDLSNSLLGSYVITYSTNGICGNSSSQTIDIVDEDDVSFGYYGAHFCASDINQTPVITGVSGGSFSAFPGGLSIDSNTGEVDVANSVTGSYFITYTSLSSCPTSDSVVFVIDELPVVSLNDQVCDSVLINGNIYYNSQIVSDTIIGVFCDSIVNTNLIVNYSNSGVDQESAWCNYTWIDGIEYLEDNISATYMLINQFGCDSLVTLNLDISKVDNSIELLNSTFVSNASNATYQWVNCTQGYSLIPGATGKTFTPMQNGNYAVIVTENACVDTSECIFLTNLSVSNYEESFQVDVYPNPFYEKVNVVLEEPSNFEVFISDIEGRLIRKYFFENKQDTIISMQLEAGLYFITIISDNQKKVFRVVRE